MAIRHARRVFIQRDEGDYRVARVLRHLLDNARPRSGVHFVVLPQQQQRRPRSQQRQQSDAFEAKSLVLPVAKNLVLSTASRSPRCLSDSGDRLHSHARPWVCLRALSEPRACLMPSAPFGPSRRQDDNPHRASLLSTLLTDLVARWFRGAGVSCRGLPAKGRGYYVGGRPCERIPRRCMAVFRVLWVAEVVRVLRVCRSELTPSFLAAHVSGACPGAIICRRANCAERSALGLFCHNLVLVIIVTLTTFPPTLCLSAPVCMCLSAPSTLCLHGTCGQTSCRDGNLLCT
jgi:hypothetical protein